MKDTSPLAAVRERIAEALKTAKPWLPQPDHHAIGEEHMAEDVVWLANALEAVLALWSSGIPVRAVPTTKWSGDGVAGGIPMVAFQRNSLEAALTRATATTEGAK